MRTGTLSATQFTKELKEGEWEELYFHHREMSEAAGAKKPSESHKAKALWVMKAAKDRERILLPRSQRQHLAKETDES